MTSPSTTASNFENPPLSEGARIINTFIAPSKTFADLRRNSSWWVPWLLVSLASIAFLVTIDKKIGFEQANRNIIEKSSKAEQFEKLPPEQRAKQIQAATGITRIITYANPVITLIVFVVIAALLMATFRFGVGAEVPFKTSLAIVSYANLPGIILAIVGIASVMAVDPEGFNLRNPVATNPAYFMDPSGNPFLYSLLSALDVFTIWTIVLTALGFAQNSKMKRGTAFTVVVVWYLVYKLGGAALAAAFS